MESEPKVLEIVTHRAACTTPSCKLQGVRPRRPLDHFTQVLGDKLVSLFGGKPAHYVQWLRCSCDARNRGPAGVAAWRGLFSGRTIMGWRTWNRLAVVSCSVAAGGVVVCVVALLNLAADRKSTLGLAAWLVGVVVAVSLVTYCYAWACERCEQFLSTRFDRRWSRACRAGQTGWDRPKEENRSTLAANRAAEPRFSYPETLPVTSDGRWDSPSPECSGLTRPRAK
jgi:hypothetical protein